MYLMTISLVTFRVISSSGFKVLTSLGKEYDKGLCFRKKAFSGSRGPFFKKNLGSPPCGEHTAQRD
jgi:hypothetical protein